MFLLEDVLSLTMGINSTASESRLPKFKSTYAQFPHLQSENNGHNHFPELWLKVR